MKTILVVDDELSLREYYKEFLSENGYKVIVAENGKEGIDAFVNHNPDLVLLDISMPDTNGIVILKEMKKLNSNIPVFLLTAYEEHKRNFATLYAEEYIIKNKKPEIILKRIRAFTQ
jgi:DNA-binding response OmpR family regulator